MMKKILFVLLGIFALLIVLAVTLPIIYKDDIRAKLDQEIAKSVNAQVYFDTDKFSLSLFRDFPSLSVSMQDFGIVGKDVFEGDTLISVSDFTVSINLRSVLFGDQIRISGIELIKPRILVMVLEDGRANYDIMIPTEEEEDATVADSTETTPLSIKIDHWKIVDGHLVYSDDLSKFFMDVNGLNHSASGSYIGDIFDMKSSSQIQSLTVAYEEVEYLSKKVVDAKIDLAMDLEKFIFTFKDNQVKLNEFAFSFDGFFAMPEEGFDMDIRYATKENSFKSLLSLVPNIYNDSFDGIETSGSLNFNGFVKGMYTDTQMPAFNLNLLVSDGFMKYPDLPTAVKNIQVDLVIDNQSGDLEETMVNLKSMHMDMGSNPFDARLLMNGFKTMNVDAQLVSKLNLEEINQMFPVEGLSLKGILDIDFIAKGTYDSVKNQIPTLNGKFQLSNAYVKSAEVPYPIEKLNLLASIINTDEQMANTVLDITDFSMSMNNEDFTASLKVENFSDYTWNLKAKGGLDLESITKIYPIAGMSISGKVKANIQSIGKMSDVEAERYEKLNTSGSASLQNFSFSSADLPQGLTIANSEMAFTPTRVELKSYQGTLGKSDVRMTGWLSNYIGYALTDNQVLKGELNFNSNKFDANEWLTETEGESTATADTIPMTVIEIPKTIDFTLNAGIQELLYTNMVITDMKGKIIVRDGTVKMEGVQFNSLGGSFSLSGLYDTRNMEKPAFDFAFGIKNLEIRKAYETFSTIQKLAPVAEKMEGRFSTDFKLNGLIASDMSPVYSSLLGAGVIQLQKAAIRDSKMLSGINAITNQKGGNSFELNDVLMQAEVKDGRVHLKPFDVNVAGNKTTISGSNGMDGSLDYLLKMNINAGAAGAALNNLIASVGGGSNNSSTIKLNLKVAGVYGDPKVSLAGSEAGESTGSSAKSAVGDRVNAEVDKAKEEAEKARAEAEAKARAEAERLKKEAEDKAKKEAEDLKKKAKDKAKDFLKGGK